MVESNIFNKVYGGPLKIYLRHLRLRVLTERNKMYNDRKLMGPFWDKLYLGDHSKTNN